MIVGDVDGDVDGEAVGDDGDREGDAEGLALEDVRRRVVGGWRFVEFKTSPVIPPFPQHGATHMGSTRTTDFSCDADEVPVESARRTALSIIWATRDVSPRASSPI